MTGPRASVRSKPSPPADVAPVAADVVPLLSSSWSDGQSILGLMIVGKPHSVLYGCPRRGVGACNSVPNPTPPPPFALADPYNWALPALKRAAATFPEEARPELLAEVDRMKGLARPRRGPLIKKMSTPLRQIRQSYLRAIARDNPSPVKLYPDHMDRVITALLNFVSGLDGVAAEGASAVLVRDRGAVVAWRECSL